MKYLIKIDITSNLFKMIYRLFDKNFQISLREGWEHVESRSESCKNFYLISYLSYDQLIINWLTSTDVLSILHSYVSVKYALLSVLIIAI